MDQDEARSQDQEPSSEPEVDQLDSISQTTAQLNGPIEEEEEEVPPVEMCDQEVQTDLSTLEMVEAELYELFGEPQDESL